MLKSKIVFAAVLCLAFILQPSALFTSVGQIVLLNDSTVGRGLSLQSGVTVIIESSNALNTGLISYWKLDEASGTRNDSHSTNHLTDVNTVTQGTGKILNAGQFIAANSESLSVADNASFSLTNYFSISMWINRDTISINQTLFSKWTYQTDGEFAFQTSNTLATDFKALLATSAADSGNGCEMQSVNVAVTTNIWFHLAVIFDGTLTGNTNRLKVYVNGSVIASTMNVGNVPATLFAGTAPIVIGNWSGSLNRPWNGRIDEVAIWNRAITASEVAEMYNSGNGKAYPF